MTKILNGKELADFVKQRQIHQVRRLIQADKIQPRLAIITTSEVGAVSPTEVYLRMKQNYARDILIEAETFREENPPKIAQLIQELNSDTQTSGMIVQLPLAGADEKTTREILNLIAPEKDVDGLGENARFDSATAVAINWLLAGYNIDLLQKKIAVVGQGKLVGAPLFKLWRDSGFDVTALDEFSRNIPETIAQADVVVTATGAPGLIRERWLKNGAVVIDAGTATDKGKIVGDLEAKARERKDLILTPEKGGVGPLTIAALFDNVIRAAAKFQKSRTKN